MMPLLRASSTLAAQVAFWTSVESLMAKDTIPHKEGIIIWPLVYLKP